MKLKRAILKIQFRFSQTQLVFRGHVPEAKMFLGSYLIVGKEKSEKDHFINFSEISFLEFVRTEWTELALSTHKNSDKLLHET